MDEPRYGYGKDRRPLWSPRDRDAEAVRRALRKAGFRDFSDRHPVGFAVEGANASEDGPEPFGVMYCGYPENPTMVDRYADALERAGFQVSADPMEGAGLLVQRPVAGFVRPAAQPGRALLAAAIICAVLATAALLASWAGTGHTRLAGGVGSAVFGAVAALIAGLWYRRQATSP